MLIIKNGHIVDPMNKTDGVFDIAAEGAVIREIGKDLPCAAKDNVIDASGCYVVPGLIDHHAHVQPWRRSAFRRKPAASPPE